MKQQLIKLNWRKCTVVRHMVGSWCVEYRNKKTAKQKKQPCCWIMILHTVKICHSYWFIKALIGQDPDSRTTIIGEFWKEESYKPEAKEA